MTTKRDTWKKGLQHQLASGRSCVDVAVVKKSGLANQLGRTGSGRRDFLAGRQELWGLREEGIFARRHGGMLGG